LTLMSRIKSATGCPQDLLVPRGLQDPLGVTELPVSMALLAPRACRELRAFPACLESKANQARMVHPALKAFKARAAAAVLKAAMVRMAPKVKLVALAL